MLLVTGDEASCAEARELLGDALTTVAVKRGLGAGSARMIPPQTGARADRGRRQARACRPPGGAALGPGQPCEIKVEFKNTVAPDKLRFRSGVERVDERMIVSRADTWWEAWRQYYF